MCCYTGHSHSTAPTHFTQFSRSTVESSPGTKVSDAFMTFYRKQVEEKSMRKDLELEKMQIDMERLKRERVDQIAEKNLEALHLNIVDALRRMK